MGGRYLPETYFSEGVWAASGPLRLRSHTCVQCGTRFKGFEAFKAHRRTDECRALAAQQADTLPWWAKAA